MDALLAASDLRIDVDGVPACDGLSVEITGERVLVLGAPRALYEAAIGLSAPLRGTLLVRGKPAFEAARLRIIAGAEAAPMPPGWTLREYVGWSARLTGLDRATAERQADAAIEAMELTAFATTTIAKLVPPARRATLVAAAIATGAETIALDDPLADLPDEAAAALGLIIAGALEGRSWIVFAPRMPLASPLARAADEAVITRESGVLAQGAPATIAAAERRFVLRVLGEPEGLAAVAEGLAARGGALERRGDRLFVELGAEASAGDVVALCAAAGLSVVELMPLARAFG